MREMKNIRGMKTSHRIQVCGAAIRFLLQTLVLNERIERLEQGNCVGLLTNCFPPEPGYH